MTTTTALTAPATDALAALINEAAGVLMSGVVVHDRYDADLQRCFSRIEARPHPDGTVTVGCSVGCSVAGCDSTASTAITATIDAATGHLSAGHIFDVPDTDGTVKVFVPDCTCRFVFDLADGSHRPVKGESCIKFF